MLLKTDRGQINKWRSSAIIVTTVLIFGLVTTLFDFPPCSWYSAESWLLSNDRYHCQTMDSCKLSSSNNVLVPFTFCLNANKMSQYNTVLSTCPCFFFILTTRCMLQCVLSSSSIAAYFFFLARYTLFANNSEIGVKRQKTTYGK